MSEFEAALDELTAEGGVLTRRALVMLSGPSPTECDAFFARWREVSAERKREIMAQLVESAEEWFELDYVALFRRCLQDSDPVVRCHAIDGLWEDESADLVEPLRKSLSSDSHADVRACAAVSLGRFVFQAECGQLSSRRAATIRGALERAVQDPQEEIEVVRRAIESLAYINDDRVRRLIDWAYEHDDQGMRQSALFAMGRSADGFWADTVLAELHNDSPPIRYEAARACGELQLAPAVAPLIGMVQDPDREMQEMAVWALGQIGGERARKALTHWAECPDEVLSSAATDALAELEFATRPMDLFAQDPDDVRFTGIELGTGHELTEAAAELADDESNDGSLGLDEASDGPR